MGESRQVQVQFVTYDDRIKLSQNVLSIPVSITISQMSSMIFSMLQIERTVADSLLPSSLVFEINGYLVEDTLDKSVEKLNLEEERLITIRYSVQLSDSELQDSVDLPDWLACVDATDELLLASCFNGNINVYKNNELLQSIKNVDINMNYDAKFLCKNKTYPSFLCCIKNCNIGMFKHNGDGYFLTHKFVGHNEPVTSISPSTNHNFFASGSTDRLVKLWNFADCTEKKKQKKSEKPASAPIISFSGHSDVVTKVTWGKESELLSCAWDMSIKMWDIEESKLSRHIATKFAINDIDFDGEFSLLSASGKIVQLWDYRTRELSSTISSKYDSVTSVVKFSPANINEFLVASHHGATHMWDRRNLRKPLYRVHLTKQKIFSVYLDEKRIIMGGQDGKILFYPLI